MTSRSLGFKNKYTSKYWRNTKTTITIVLASSLVKKTRDSTVGTNKAYSNKRNRDDKYSYGEPEPAGRVCT